MSATSHSRSQSNNWDCVEKFLNIWCCCFGSIALTGEGGKDLPALQYQFSLYKYTGKSEDRVIISKHQGDNFSGFVGSIDFSSCPLCTTAQHTGLFKFVHCWLDGSGWLRLKGKLQRFGVNPLKGFSGVTATPPSHGPAALQVQMSG